VRRAGGVRHGQIAGDLLREARGTAAALKRAARTESSTLGYGKNPRALGRPAANPYSAPRRATGTVHRLDGSGPGGVRPPGLRYSRAPRETAGMVQLVAGYRRSFPQDSSVVLSFMR
jgi:hypothetical protein